VLTAAALIRDGFFPKELPPSFGTAPLGELFESQPAAIPLDGDPTECARHNLARLGGIRRPLKVPNPRTYIQLASTLESEWDVIDAHLNSQGLAISRPVVTPKGERAVQPRFHIAEAPKLRARDWRGQKFVLYGDVSQFYPTLYTHAIPWALHTKPVAKANKNQTDGDRIDRAVRHCSSGQTIGVPIGPDASFIIAEIVLTAVDASLKASLPTLRGFRYLDDYEAAFQTRSEAEEAQGRLEAALAEFELVVNPFKTRVIELPQPFKTTWTKELAAFPIRDDTATKTLNDTIALFSRAAELAGRNLGALTYALRKSQNISVDENLWPTFQSLVWNAVSVEPTTMAVALDLLVVKSVEVGKDVNRAAAAEVLEALLKRHAPLRNASEVAWALWAAITLEVDLSQDVADVISAMEDDFVALLALDANARGRFGADPIDTSAWETLVDYDEVLMGEHWLLAYEGAAQGWIGTSVPRVQADPFFNVLLANGVHFYDPDPEHDPFTGPAGPLGGAPLPDSYM
jgi:hypothetical protein